jgi:ParB family chromosome partitioning protein
LVRKVLAGEVKPAAKPAAPLPEVRALEERFQESLGTRVNLKAGRKGGRVIIYYYSDEEFQSLYQRLTGETL